MKASLIIASYTSIFFCGSIAAPSDPLFDQSTFEPGYAIHVVDTIRDVLKDNEIIPDVLDDFEPTYLLDVVYPATKHHDASVVDLGNDLLVKSVSYRPMFNLKTIPKLINVEREENSAFTLILTDPDALSREHPVKSEMCHWIYTNITLSSTLFPVSIENDVQVLKSKKHSNELESYFPPAPPPKTGPHRYVFVLLKGAADTSPRKPKERAHWGYGKQRHGVRDWAKENDLEVVGANFFFASNKKQ